MAYNALKSIDLTNFVNVLMWFLVSCSNGEGQVSPVRTLAFRRILLAFSNCLRVVILNRWPPVLVQSVCLQYSDLLTSIPFCNSYVVYLGFLSFFLFLIELCYYAHLYLYLI